MNTASGALIQTLRKFLHGLSEIKKIKKPWELFTACFSLMQAHSLWTVSSSHFVPTIVSLKKQSVEEVQPHVMSTQHGQITEWKLNFKYLMSCLLWCSAFIMKLSHDLSCRTKVVLDTFIGKDRIKHQSQELLPTPSGSPEVDSFTSVCFFSQNQTENVYILEDETHFSGRKKNNRKSQLASEASVAYWPISLLITNVVCLAHPHFLKWGHFPHKNE